MPFNRGRGRKWSWKPHPLLHFPLYHLPIPQQSLAKAPGDPSLTPSPARKLLTTLTPNQSSIQDAKPLTQRPPLDGDGGLAWSVESPA